MSHSIYSEGLRADPNKLKAINEMLPPTDKEGVQRVIGMINYLQKFATNLADLAKPMRELFKKDNDQCSSSSTPKRRPYSSATPL